MSEITTTPESDRGRPRRLRRLMTGVAGAVAVMILASGVAVGTFAPAANADVNTNGVWTSYQWSDCSSHVGNLKNPQYYAIGDTTVYCSSYHNISVYTELYRRPVGGSYYTLVGTSPSPYSPFWNTRYVPDVWTNSYRCGGVAAWYTYSWVSIDGSGWWGFKGPEAFWAPGC